MALPMGNLLNLITMLPHNQNLLIEIYSYYRVEGLN